MSLPSPYAVLNTSPAPRPPRAITAHIGTHWHLIRPPRFDPPCLDGVYCLFGTDPLHHGHTVRAAATVVSDTRLRCLTPSLGDTVSGGFGGFSPVPVSVILNGDELVRGGTCGVVATEAGPCGFINYTYYDARHARIEASDSRGGPLNGGTWVRLRGRLFADFRRQAGEWPQRPS